MTQSVAQRLALRTPQGLRAWRLDHGLSQVQLARLLEVQYQTVYRWENGKIAIPRTVELALLYLNNAGLESVEKG
jgi:DNA-binding transcriptional regulator YiaG